jgi:hypothetical protein
MLTIMFAATPTKQSRYAGFCSFTARPDSVEGFHMYVPEASKRPTLRRRLVGRRSSWPAPMVSLRRVHGTIELWRTDLGQDCVYIPPTARW